MTTVTAVHWCYIIVICVWILSRVAAVTCSCGQQFCYQGQVIGLPVILLHIMFVIHEDFLFLSFLLIVIFLLLPREKSGWPIFYLASTHANQSLYQVFIVARSGHAAEILCQRECCKTLAECICCVSETLQTVVTINKIDLEVQCLYMQMQM